MKTFLFVVGAFYFSTLSTHSISSIECNDIGAQNKIKNTYAVVVGVSNYADQEFPDLKYAHRDAEAFATFLQSKPGGEVPKENIRLLTDAYATGGHLHAALDWLSEYSGKADRIIIYLAGYGDTRISKKGTPTYFFPSDSPVIPLRVGAFDMEEIALLLHGTDYLLIANFYPLELPLDFYLKNKKEKPLFAHSFNLNLISPEDYEPKSQIEKTIPLAPNVGKITNNYLLLDGLLGMADRDHDHQVHFQELKKYLQKAKPMTERLPGMLFLAASERNPLLVEVDKKTLKKLELHNDEMFPSIVHLETNEREDRILKNVSKEVQLTYGDFVVAVKLGHLLEPVEKNALFFYEQLITEPGLQELHSDLRRKLAVALQDEVQQALNAYIKLDHSELQRREKMVEPYEQYTTYLEKAIDLMGHRSFMGRLLKAKHQYFCGLVLRMRAVQENRLELLDEAIEEQQSALELEPEASFIINEIGVIFYLKNYLTTAESYFKKASLYSPSWSIPYSNLCFIKAKVGDYDIAIKYGIKAFQYSPHNVFVSNTLAGVYLDAGDLYSAERMYQLVLQKDPTNTQALYDVACIHARSGKRESALVYLEKALKSGFDDKVHLLTDEDLTALHQIGRAHV